MQQIFRAIVLDDMDICRDLLTDFLQDRGYQVISFPDATTCPLFPARKAECIKETACADFLLTDNRMPHIEGIDFLELQRQGKCRINTFGKAIFSAHWDQKDLVKAKQLNCKSFSKPYDLVMLGKWLDEQEKLIPADRKLTKFEDIMSLTNQDGTKSVR